MGRQIFIDFQNGTDAGSNEGLTESAPRKTRPGAPLAGDVLRFRRGTVYDAVSQFLATTAQGIILTDYGNPDAPKPKIRSTMPASTHCLQFGGDTILHNIEFADIQRSTSETTISNVGPNACGFVTRGAGSVGSADGVSAVVINCDFNNIGNNALYLSGSNSASFYASGNPVLIVLGSTFNGIGGDGIFGSVRDYMEVGWCEFSDLGNRIDTLITPPAGGRQAASDAIGLLGSVPAFGWIHDNRMDHSAWDCKQIVMLDAPAAQAGNLCLIERNVMIGYGVGYGQTFNQAYFNAGINTSMKTIIRQNYIRTSRLALNFLANAVGSEAYSNIIDVPGSDGLDGMISVLANKVSLRHNTIYARQKINGAAIVRASGVTGFAASRNMIANYAKGLSFNGGVTDAAYHRNAFANVDSRYVVGSTPQAEGTSDVIGGLDLVDPVSLRPRDHRLLFKQTDRRLPDFFGRFNPEGIAYIGATLGVQ